LNWRGLEAQDVSPAGSGEHPVDLLAIWNLEKILPVVSVSVLPLLRFFDVGDGIT
jgi:hypothetical protein